MTDKYIVFLNDDSSSGVLEDISDAYRYVLQHKDSISGVVLLFELNGAHLSENLSVEDFIMSAKQEQEGGNL